MLGDNIVERTFRPTVEHFARQGGGARIVLTEADDPAHLRHLGVPQFDAERRITHIVEKPEDPPTQLPPSPASTATTPRCSR